METSTIETVAGLLSKGGNAALIFSLWIAWSALNRAKEALQHLKEMRDATVESAPLIKEIAANTADVDNRTRAMDTRSEQHGLKLDALLARSKSS